MFKSQDAFLKYFYYLIILLTLIPIVFHCYVFLKYSTNAPYYDDFYWGISFLRDYISSSSIAEKLKLIFQQHAQHRIAYFRLFMVGYYHIFGTINFKHLTIFGNISNLIVFLLLAFLLKKEKSNRYFILPIALILFQFQYFQNIISTYGFPNMAVYMWAILAFYCMTIPTKRAFYLTILFACLSVFSNGNGILSFPIILFFIFIQARFADLKIASLLFVIFIVIYFATFEKMAGEILLSWQTVIYFFQFLNSAFYTGHHKIEMAAVVLIIGLFSVKFLIDCYHIYFKKQKIDNFQFWIFVSATILWIFATALSVAIYRAIRNASIPNWYMNYSVLLIVFSTLFLLITVKNRNLKILFFLILTGYGISNYLKNIKLILPTIQVFQSNLNADIINFNIHKNWSFLLTQVGYPLFKDFEKLSNSFYEKGIYMPEKINDALTNVPDSMSMAKGKFRYELNAIGESLINFDMLKNSPEKLEVKERFGFIKSAENIYFFGVVNPINTNWVDVLRNQRLFEEESFFIVPPKFFDVAIKQNDYQIGMVFINKNDRLKWYISDQKLKVENY